MGEVILNQFAELELAAKLNNDNSCIERPLYALIRANWLLPTVEAVTAVMCSAAPLEHKIRASCAALVDHAMASGAWLMSSQNNQSVILAAESEDEDLHQIISDQGLNDLLMRRLRQAGMESEITFDPVIQRQFDALGFSRDFVAAPLVLSGQVIGTLSCLFHPDLHRGDQELQAVEIIARIMAMVLQGANINKGVIQSNLMSNAVPDGLPIFQPKELRDSKSYGDDPSRLEAIIRSLPGSVVVTNIHGITTEVMPGSAMSEALPLKKAGNQGWLFNFIADHAQHAQQSAVRKALRGETSTCQFQVGDWTGSTDVAHVIEETFNPVKNSQGEVIEVIGYAQDVTDRVLMNETLRQLRNHDGITDCMTMAALHEHAEREIINMAQHRSALAFYTIEIEKTGTGIHLLGQSSFEELLQTVVARIRRQLPRFHILARRGDHSFVAVARLDTSAQNIEISANNIVRVLTDPIVTGRYEYFISTNVGYSKYPDDGGTLDEMLYNSDIAAMSAARERHNIALAFNPSMATEANDRVRIETALHRAVDHEEFELAYQPKVDLITGDVAGVEALIRWPGRHNISPAKFIPLAEECGLISFIGEWALRQACKVVTIWSRSGYRIPISVNVSTRQFHDSDFHSIVEEVLQETGCDPDLLELEVTEGVLIRDPQAAITSFNQLKKLGVKISIDDFGTGFSSLSYLKHLPVDKLKIDRTFVLGLPGEKDNEAITKAILAMADAMDLRTIAEGVEDFECLKHLRAMGCHEIQGYYFSKPLFESEFLKWYSAYQAVRQMRISDQLPVIGTVGNLGYPG